MKKARMNISHFRFILLNLTIFGEIVTTYGISMKVWKIVFHFILKVFHSIPFWHLPYSIPKFLFHSISCLSQARRHGGHFGAVPCKSLLVPPQTKIVPPSEVCAPKKVTGSVPLKCSSRPETPKILGITPKFVSKNCFFADFAIKILMFCSFTPEFMKIRAFF